jgi:glucose-1-phosphate thymidylyltransferase
MRLIVPMAGRGTRLRPHTHVTPKPLIPVCGTSMVERIIKSIAGVLPRELDEAVFILGPDFPQEVQDRLSEICGRLGIEAGFGVQERALGTAHAVHQAGDRLAGECVIVFADTLFYMDEKLDLEDADGVLWVKHVDDPRRFGVVVKDDAGAITDFVEKPQEPISNEAIIGIYYIKDGAKLGRDIQYLIDHEVKGTGGEYQLTDALDRMLKDGAVFRTAAVNEWLDAGTIPALKETTKIILEKEQADAKQGRVDNSIVIEPVFIGAGAAVTDSVVGPYVAIHGNARVNGSVLRDTIVFEDATVEGASLDDSIVGQHALVQSVAGRINIGDHSEVVG